MFLVPLLLVIPFIQIGFTFYLSVAGISSVGIVILYFREIILSLTRDMPIKVAVVLAMSLSLIANSFVDIQDVLRVAREALFLLLFVGIIPFATKRLPRKTVLLALRLSHVILLLMLALAIVQAVFLSRGIYFGIPKTYFSQNQDTIASALDLAFSRIRPSSTLAEPSYLGFICLSFAFMWVPALWKSRSVQILVGECALLCIISATSSGMLSLSIFVAVALALSSRGKLRAIVAVGGVAALAAIFGAAQAVLRVSESSNDLAEFSGYVRLFAPLLVLPEFLTQHVFGMPFAKLLALGEVYGLPITWDQLLDNGFYNLWFCYGIGAVGIIAVSMLCIRDRITLIYLLFSLLQNGAFFTIDKFVVIVVAITVYRQFSYPHVAKHNGKPRALNRIKPSVFLNGFRHARIPKSTNCAPQDLVNFS